MTQPEKNEHYLGNVLFLKVLITLFWHHNPNVIPGRICQIHVNLLKKFLGLYQYDKEFSLRMTETTYRMNDKMFTKHSNVMPQISNNIQK